MATVVAKIGSSSITDGNGDIDHGALTKLCAEVAGLCEAGHRVVVVTSGAIAAGRPALGISATDHPDIVTLQAVSTVGQSRLMRVYDEAMAGHGLIAGQILIAPLDFMERSQYLHARVTLNRLLALGVVPIVNENDALADDAIRFGAGLRWSAGSSSGRRRITWSTGLRSKHPVRLPPGCSPIWPVSSGSVRSPKSRRPVTSGRSLRHTHHRHRPLRCVCTNGSCGART